MNEKNGLLIEKLLESIIFLLLRSQYERNAQIINYLPYQYHSRYKLKITNK